MPSVAFLTRDFSPGTNPLQPGGCAWYRCYLPSLALRDHAWESGMGLPDWDLARGWGLRHTHDSVIAGWDAVVLKLLMERDTPHQVRQASKTGQKVIVDVDDFYAGLTKDNQAYAVTDPTANPDHNRDHYERVIEAADVVIVSTPFLLDWYSERHPDVRMVRNGIDMGRWHRRKDKAGWRPTLGWVGGIPWRSGDLETLREWLPQFVTEHGLGVQHSGHLDRGEPFWVKAGVPESVMSTAPMCMIADYPNLFDGFQIGLVPLNDIPFNHAKSTIKGLEYAAAGIPFIAAATPEYVRLANNGIGRVASSPDEWLKHATDLLDPAVRKREGARQRVLVSQQFSMTQRGREWDQVLRDVVTAP